MTFATANGAIPYVDTAQMVEVDRAMIEDDRIELIQMMENAGRNLAHLARVRFLDGDPRGKRILVKAGRGGNGGGALVAARRLHTWGADVTVSLGQAPQAMTPVPAHQPDILQQMDVPGTRAAADVRDHVGELYLADISVPPVLYASPQLHMEVGPLFARDDVIRLW